MWSSCRPETLCNPRNPERVHRRESPAPHAPLSYGWWFYSYAYPLSKLCSFDMRLLCSQVGELAHDASTWWYGVNNDDQLQEGFLFWEFHVYSCCGQGRHMLIGKLQKLEEKSKQEVDGS